jgi:hypothetical protein
LGQNAKRWIAPVMAGQAEATQIAGFGEDRELRKRNGGRIQTTNNDLVEESRFSD